MEGDFVSPNDEMEHILNAAAYNSEVHFCALGTAEALHNVSTRHLNTSDRGVVDRHDTVAGDDSHLFRRTVHHGLNHEQRVLDHVELHSDALKVAL